MTFRIYSIPSHTPYRNMSVPSILQAHPQQIRAKANLFTSEGFHISVIPSHCYMLHNYHYNFRVYKLFTPTSSVHHCKTYSYKTCALIPIARLFQRLASILSIVLAIVSEIILYTESLVELNRSSLRGRALRVRINSTHFQYFLLGISKKNTALLFHQFQRQAVFFFYV
jgi:hypothetical protein